MSATTRRIVLLSTLLLSLLPGLASATDRAVSLDKRACDTPDYPVAWQDRDQQGAVKLALLIGADGRVQDAKVVESSGFPSLDKASLRASASCKFMPAVKDGTLTTAWTNLQYSWVLN